MKLVPAADSSGVLSQDRLTSKCAPWMAALPVSQPSVLRMAGTPRSQPYTPTRWLRSRRASHPYHGWLQLQDPSHSALQARAILAAFQPVQPSSGRWLRWLCPGHPPGRMMAVIQPSQPSAGGWLSRIRPSLLAAPTRAQVAPLSLREPPHLVLDGWRRYLSAIALERLVRI